MAIAPAPREPATEQRSSRIETITVEVDDPARADVRQLMTEHLADMFKTSPAESVHALDLDALAHRSITFFTARADGVLLSCGALTTLGGREGEVKSMRTTHAARGRGVATLVLGAILDEARRRDYDFVRLETGAEDYFVPARNLYRRCGFVEGPPFGDYRLDPSSVFMSLDLR